jgi:hypothetical protein
MEKSAILSALAAEVEQGRLIFPTSTHAAIKIKEKLEDPDCSLDAVIRLIQAEPLLSTKVVAIANSAVFNRSGQKSHRCAFGRHIDRHAHGAQLGYGHSRAAIDRTAGKKRTSRATMAAFRVCRRVGASHRPPRHPQGPRNRVVCRHDS